MKARTFEERIDYTPFIPREYDAYLSEQMPLHHWLAEEEDDELDFLSWHTEAWED